MESDPAALWNSISDLTDNSGEDEIDSLRVLVYSLVNREDNDVGHWDLRHRLALLLDFRPRGSPLLPSVQERLPVMLFPYSTGSNLLNLKPVAAEAVRRGLLAGIVVGREGPSQLTGYGAKVTERDLSCHTGMRDFARILAAARARYRKLLVRLERLGPVFVRRVQSRRGLIMRHLVWSHRMQVGYAKLFAAWKPSCVISTSDYWPGEFQFYCQAKRLGIANAMIQHGEFTSPLAWPIYADAFLIWGQRFREKLLTLGATPERLRICGMPSSDELMARAAAAGPRQPDATSPVCLLFSHAHDRFEEPDLFAAFASYLKAVIEANPTVKWQIKLHPAEDDSFYREQHIASRVEILPGFMTLQEAVEKADVVFTIRSTAGLQAMMLRRPLLVVDIVKGSGASVDWPAQGGGIAAATPAAFSASLQRLIRDDNFRDAILQAQKQFIDTSFAHAGRAASAVVDYMEEQTRIARAKPISGRLA